MSWKKTLVIGISGVTNGGKSILVESLLTFFNAPLANVKCIHQDDYFYPEESHHHVMSPGGIKHFNWEVMTGLDMEKMVLDVTNSILTLDSNFESKSENSNLQNRRMENSNLESRIENLNLKTSTENSNLETSTNNSNFESRMENSNLETRTENSNLETRIENSNLETRIENLNLETSTENSNWESRKENSNLKSRKENSNLETRTENSNLESRTENSNLETRTENSNLETRSENSSSVFPAGKVNEKNLQTDLICGNIESKSKIEQILAENPDDKPGILSNGNTDMVTSGKDSKELPYTFAEVSHSFNANVSSSAQSNCNNIEHSRFSKTKLRLGFDKLSINSLRPKLMLDGFILYEDPQIYNMCDVKIFVTLSKSECLKRRSGRVYDPPDIDGYFEACVWPEYERHLRYVKKNCPDVIYLDGMLSQVQLLNAVLQKIVDSDCFL